MVRKTIDLSEEKEPDIFGAIKGPAGLLENVAVDDLFRPDYSDTSKTANGRVSYPIYHSTFDWSLLAPFDASRLFDSCFHPS